MPYLLEKCIFGIIFFLQKYTPYCCCTSTKFLSFCQVVFIFSCNFSSRLRRTFLRNTLYVDRWIDRWIDRYIDRQIDVQTDRQIYRQIDRKIVGQKERSRWRDLDIDDKIDAQLLPQTFRLESQVATRIKEFRGKLVPA